MRDRRVLPAPPLPARPALALAWPALAWPVLAWPAPAGCAAAAVSGGGAGGASPVSRDGIRPLRPEQAGIGPGAGFGTVETPIGVLSLPLVLAGAVAVLAAVAASLYLWHRSRTTPAPASFPGPVSFAAPVSGPFPVPDDRWTGNTEPGRDPGTAPPLPAAPPAPPFPEARPAPPPSGTHVAPPFPEAPPAPPPSGTRPEPPPPGTPPEPPLPGTPPAPPFSETPPGSPDDRTDAPGTAPDTATDTDPGADPAADPLTAALTEVAGSGISPALAQQVERLLAEGHPGREALVAACVGYRDQLAERHPRLAGTLLDGLSRAGVRELVADGQRFDPRLHEASGTEPAPRPDLHDLVAETVRCGYADGERVIRVPRVVVYRDGTPGTGAER